MDDVLVIEQELSRVLGLFFSLGGKSVKRHDMTPDADALRLGEVNDGSVNVGVFFYQLDDAVVGGLQPEIK